MLTAPETRLLARVACDQGWSLVETFARTRREQPEEFERGAAHLLSRLHDLKLPVSIHRPAIYLGIPRNTTLVCEGVSYHSKAAALSPDQPALSAPLVYLPARDGASRVHTNDPALLFAEAFTQGTLRTRVAGQVVLTEGLSNPARSELLEAMGALAVITINPGDAVHWGASSVVWGSPGLDELSRLPGIVSMAVNRGDGTRLAQAAQRGAQVSLSADVQHGWFEQTLPLVEIEASGPQAHEFVLLHGHLDSWDLGVGDNATGNAVLLEAARALHAERATLRRSVRIAWWPGHSAGRYAGSTWFADRFAHSLRAGAVAHLNCDSPGCRDASDYTSIRGMAEAQPLVEAAVADLFGQRCVLERPGRAGDYSFNNLGISGAMLTSSMVPPQERQRRGWYSVGGNGGSPSWHTEDDVLAVADAHVLQNDARLYCLLASRLACGETPLLDYRRAIAEIRSRLAAADDAVGEHVDFSAHAALAGRLSDAVDQAYAEGSAAPRSARWPALLRASRAIVRAGYAERGPFEQDPAYAQAAVPMLGASARAAETPAARVTLQRGANALRHEMETALAELA